MSGDRHVLTGPVKVTISDPATGAVLGEKIVADDYLLITVGDRYVKSLQVFGSTHMIAVAKMKSARK